ncbi:MFS transporter [Nitrosomonas sp.]|uniref:MFS transporter n=1 Tax=Nitrosomonas sp. TaxID=42353 RepID=UPI0025D7941F|nr:MFS transporter [Nitrosomonas sp.]
MLTPLRNSTYRHLFAAQIISLLGTGLTTVALALLAYDLAGDKAGIVLGAALAIKMIAYVSIAPIVGGLAASLPRKKLLVILDIIRAGFVLCLPFVEEIWQIYLIIFLMQSCSAGFTPMLQATILDIIPDESTYTKALSLSRLAYDLESLVSPMLAATALLFMSFNVLFAFNALAFLISALIVVTALLPKRKIAQEVRIVSAWEKITFGVRAYLATPILRGLLSLSMAVSAAGSIVIVNTVVIVRSGFGLGEQEVALAWAVYGGGSMLVALTLPKLLQHLPDRPLMLAGAALLAAGLLAGSFVSTFFWLLPVWFLLGSATSLINTPSGRLLRRSSAEEDRPAYFAAQFSLSHACWLLTYPLAGWLGVTLGITETFYVFSAIVSMSFVTALYLWPHQEQIALMHIHQNINPDHPHLNDAEVVQGGYQHKHDYVIDHHHRTWP